MTDEYRHATGEGDGDGLDSGNWPYQDHKVVRPNLKEPHLYRVRLPMLLVSTLKVPGWEEADEELIMTLHNQELKDLDENAREKAAEVLVDAQRCMIWEREGKTYAEVSEIITGKKDRRIKDDPYNAAEDLTFQFRLLSELWDFINQAEYLVRYLDQHVA